MRTMLEDEHRRILALADRLRTYIRAADQPSALFAGLIREEFVRMLVQHMNFKEAMIYGPLRRAAKAARVPLIEQMAEYGTALFADYEVHRARWPRDRIASEWDSYKASVIALLDRVEAAIQLERNHIYPMLTLVYEPATAPPRQEAA